MLQVIIASNLMHQIHMYINKNATTCIGMQMLTQQQNYILYACIYMHLKFVTHDSYTHICNECKVSYLVNHTRHL